MNAATTVSPASPMTLVITKIQNRLNSVASMKRRSPALAVWVDMRDAVRTMLALYAREGRSIPLPSVRSAYAFGTALAMSSSSSSSERS